MASPEAPDPGYPYVIPAGISWGCVRYGGTVFDYSKAVASYQHSILGAFQAGLAATLAFGDAARVTMGLVWEDQRED